MPVITYEYVPPGGDPDSPIVIRGVKEYSPGDHAKGADAYVIEVPEGLVAGVPNGWEVPDWRGVLEHLVHWFPGETSEGAQKRLRRTYADPVQFPQFRKS
jgi:hypothetical protein